ncbi:type VI secretion protein IcmF/TssM N-terminal domain-containing protein [Dyella silvae]|uniref:type VI secretion protein IcmF/TssM N-terminal domain-containing protein n=1 Tax=Dyella silvae TaxID=2994424 RepID=UPI00226453BF|nr:type VI secretion protein IcmF/TssM N-terminal domain-containing protein [Dyella silvae]
MRLLECFAPLFAYGLQLDEHAGKQGIPDGELGAVQSRARALVEQARMTALAEGRPLAEVELAGFAVVAWFDEVVARHGGWRNQGSPLQLLLFHTGNAASEFFDHLGGLSSDAEEVREVFGMALLLGFTGQYYYEHGDSGELGRIKALYSHAWAGAPSLLQSLQRDGITPQPYHTQGSPVLRLPGPTTGRRTMQWVAATLVVLVLVSFVAPVYSRAVPEQAWFVAGIVVALAGLLGWSLTMAWQTLVVMRAHTRVVDSTEAAYGVGNLWSAITDAARRVRGAVLHPFRRRGEWRRLSRHPWLLFLGDSAADVRSLLQAAAHAPHAREQVSSDNSRPWHWWVFRSLVAVEPGARLIHPDATAGGVESSWSQALSLLARERRKLPLDGVALCISAQSLRGSDAAIMAHADRLYRLADDAARRLELQLPLYIVVTGIEVMPGHGAFRATLPPAVFRRVLGWRRSMLSGNNQHLRGRLDVRSDAVSSRLQAAGMAALAMQRDPRGRRELFAFVQSLPDLQRGMQAFLYRLLANENGGGRRLRWCGMYVTGGSRPEAPGGDFVDDLFNRFLPADRWLARRIAPEE